MSSPPTNFAGGEAILGPIDVLIVASVVTMVLVIGVIATLQTSGIGIAFLEGCAPWLVPSNAYIYDDEYKMGSESVIRSNNSWGGGSRSSFWSSPSGRGALPVTQSTSSGVPTDGSKQYTASQPAPNQKAGTTNKPTSNPVLSTLNRRPSKGSMVGSARGRYPRQTTTATASSEAGGSAYSYASRLSGSTLYSARDGSDSEISEGSWMTDYIGNQGPVSYHDHATSFFLADKQMTFVFIGASLFASNIGSEHFVGQAGDGARRGMAVALFEWYSGIFIIALGWVFAPMYRRLGIYTTPEFMEYRFGRWTRHYLSFVTCVLYVVTKMSASIYGGARVLSSLGLGGMYYSAGICIILSTVYTVTGGLRAVMYTDLYQSVIFVAGGLIVMGFAMSDVGGFSGLEKELRNKQSLDHLKLFKGTDDAEYPWTGMIFGQPFTSLWFWCMDQDMVQRALSARDDVQCKAGCVLAATLKLIVPFIMVFPGMVVWAKYSDKLRSSSDANVFQWDDAYAILLKEVMPPGIKGLMLAAIMTAMMSSLDSVFNAGSTIITNDVYRVMYPDASPDTLVYVGRTSTIGFAILSFAWLPAYESGGGLFRTVSEIQAYLGPPIGVILLLGVTWRRANGAGAICGLITGGILGATRLVVNVVLQAAGGAASLGIGTNIAATDSVVDDGPIQNFFELYFGMAFPHFSIFVWVTSALVCIVVSLLTPAPNDGVNYFMINWKQMFTPADDSAEKYSRKVHIATNGAAVGVVIIGFVLWGIFV